MNGNVVSVECKEKECFCFTHIFCGMSVNSTKDTGSLSLAVRTPIRRTCRWPQMRSSTSRSRWYPVVGDSVWSVWVCQVLQSDLVWTHKWPFWGLSDLHLGNQKVTLKKLVCEVFVVCCWNLVFQLYQHGNDQTGNDVLVYGALMF